MNMELLISFKKSTRHNVNSETELVFHSGELHASSYVYCHPKEASYTFSSLSSMVIVLPLIRAAIFYLDEAVLILKIKKGVEAEDIDSSKVLISQKLFLVILRINMSSFSLMIMLEEQRMLDLARFLPLQILFQVKLKIHMSSFCIKEIYMIFQETLMHWNGIVRLMIILILMIQ